MIAHILNNNTNKTKKLFEAEFSCVRHGKIEFTGDIDYMDYTYRFDIPDQKELKELIEDLIELYNSREEDE